MKTYLFSGFPKLDLTLEFCLAAGESERVSEVSPSHNVWVKGGNSWSCEPLQKRCTLHWCLTGYKRNRSPLKTKKSHVLCCLFKWNVYPWKLSCPFFMLPLLCLKQDLECACGIFHVCLNKGKEKWKDFPNGFRMDSVCLGQSVSLAYMWWLVFFSTIHFLKKNMKATYGRC